MDFSKKIPDFPKSKKIYFSDPFIFAVCYKWAYSVEDNFNSYKKILEKNIDKISEGVLLNHLVYLIYNVIRSNIYDYKDLIFYWKNKANTKEVDFIYKENAFEVKWRENIKSGDYKGLDEFKKGFLVTKKDFDRRTFPMPGFLIILEKYFDTLRLI